MSLRGQGSPILPKLPTNRDHTSAGPLQDLQAGLRAKTGHDTMFSHLYNSKGSCDNPIFGYQI